MLLAGVIVAFFLGINFWRNRLLLHAADLPKLLPANSPGTTFYVDVALLRRAGYLNFAADKIEADNEYRQFTSSTGFDFARDADAIAGTVSAGGGMQAYLLARFDWEKFRAFADRHSGNCRENACVFPGSEPNRWVVLAHLQPQLLGLAITSAKEPPEADSLILPTPKQEQTPQAPVWLRFGSSVVSERHDLPLPVNAVASALRSARYATLSLHPGDNGAVLQINLDAQFPSATQAEAARTDLQSETTLLKLELAREPGSPDPADITSLLTAGSFASTGDELHASWPVRKQLLDSLR